MDFIKGLILFLGFAAGSCGIKSADQQADVDSTQTPPVEEVKPVESPAVSVWDRVSVRAEASETAKWLTSLSLGESLTYLDKAQTDEKGKTYVKIRLNDGTEGWSRTEYIIPDSKAAVFLDEADIYTRPDLLNKSNNKFSKMDIVAVKQTQGEWIEIVGKPSGEKWLKNGWVKAEHVTYTEVDIAMAKFAKPVLELENATEKKAKLEEILGTDALTASTFTPDVKTALDKLKLN